MVAMSPEQRTERIRIACTECAFSKVVTREGNKSSEVMIEHGRETDHTLVAEDPDDVE